MVPMCRKLVNIELLTAEEIAWLNAYHEEVLEKTKPLLKDERSIKFLRRECQKY